MRLFRIRHLVRSSALVVLCASIQLLNGQPAQEKVLDLTVASTESRSMGVPGYEAGGIAGQSAPRRPKLILPLDVSIRTATLASTNSAVLHLALVNRGQSAFLVPSCRDQVEAHGHGAKGRRTLAITTSYFDSNMKELDSGVAAVAFGASDGDCVMGLAPGESMVVIFRARLSKQVSGTLQSGQEVNVRASITQVDLKDSIYFIENIWEPVESGAVRLQPR